MPATTFLTSKLLDHQLGKTAYAMPIIYVGLSNSTPNLGGTGVTEPSGGAYARQTTVGATWTAAAAGSTSNAAAIAWAAASADWLTGSNMTHGVLYDALTGGNLLGYGALSVARPVLNGNIASIAIGGLVVTLT